MSNDTGGVVTVWRALLSRDRAVNRGKLTKMGCWLDMTAWHSGHLGILREGTQTTLVFALTFCYTGLRVEVSYPYAQAMTKLDEPRCQQKKDSYRQNQVTVHGDPFRLLLRY